MTQPARSHLYSERRHSTRVPTEFPTAFSTPDGESGEGTALDLSTRGCKFITETPLALKTDLELQVFVPGESPPLVIPHGIVRWANGTQYGVEFQQVPEMSRRLLQNLFGL